MKFMHLRVFDLEQKSPQNRQGISNHGGVSIAYYRSLDQLSFHYAFCLCRMSENFSRKLGRTIAVNYLQADAGYWVNTPPEVPTSYYLESVAKPTAIKKFLSKNPGFINCKTKELF